MKTDASKFPGCLRASGEWMPRLLAAAGLACCTPCTAATGPGGAVDREFSLFAGPLSPVAVGDAASREFSIFAGNLSPVAVGDAVTREFSIMVGGTPQVAANDVVAREFSILVQPPPDGDPRSIDPRLSRGRPAPSN